MKRRAGTSLVEVLIALGILVCGLLVAYILLQNSFVGFTRLDRRQTAEAISLNIQDRYFHTESSELMEKFGGPAGGRHTLENDELVQRAMPNTPENLRAMGFQMDAYAVGLDQGNGTSGLYFTTKVSWPVGSTRQFVTHSRVVASGLAHTELRMASAPEPTAPAPGMGKLLGLAVAGNVEAFGARAAAVEQALAGKGRDAPIVFEGSAKVMDQMSSALPDADRGAGSRGGASAGAGAAGGSGRMSSALGGFGGGAAGSTDSGASSASAGGFAGGGGGGGAAGGGGGSGSGSGSGFSGGGPRGGGAGGRRSTRASGSTTDWEDGGEVITAHGVSRGGSAYSGQLNGGGLEIESDRATGKRKDLTNVRVKPDGVSIDGTGLAEGTTPDPMDFLRAAAPQLSPEERQRLVPGTASTEEDLAKLWGPLEARRVPPGIYRYTAQGYLHVTARKVFRYEVLTLQADDGTERFPLISRRELTGGQVTGAYLEGAPVLERKLLAVKGVGPSGPKVAPGVTAIFERCAERIYVTRPVLLPDGSVAPFGREIAVLAWEGSENGETEGSQGKKARLDIAARWALGDPEKAAAVEAAAQASAGSVAAAFTGGQYQEKVLTPRAGEATIEEVAVNWSSAQSRDAKHHADPDGAGWKASQNYRDAVDLINAGEPARALALVERLRGEVGTKPLELERLYASLLVQVDRMDDAAAAYGDLARRPEADAGIHNNLAFIEIHRGNYTGALTAANEAIAKDPGHLTAYVNAGIANEFLGKKEDAIASYRRGLEKHPGAASLTEGLRRMGGL